MNRSFDTQLQAVLRALTDVVGPALAGSEKHVVEQLHLAVATLSFVKTRLPDARAFHRMELRAYIALCERAAGIAHEALPDLADALVALARQGEAVLADPEADLAAYETADRALRDSLTVLSNRAVGTPCQAELERLILEEGDAILRQCRQWCTPFGFELKPEDLPLPAW